jgi:hypothetical protein
MNSRIRAWQFVCAAISPRADAAIISKMRRDIELLKNAWPAVIRLADSHLVTCAVWVGLKRKGLSVFLPDDPRQYLESMYTMNTRRNTALKEQIDESIHILNEKNIVPVLLKGAAYLKAGIFSDPAERIFSDLDILVGESEMPIAIKALRSAGYRDVPSGDMDFTNHRHRPAMFRTGANGTIELHHRLVTRELEEVLPTHAAVRASIARRHGGVCYRLLTPNHMVEMSFLHSQLIDRYDETFTIGLRPIHDLIGMSTSFKGLIDWKKIDALFERHGARSHFRNYLFAAVRIAGRTTITGVHLGTREWIHYSVACARVRWERIEKIGLHEFSADVIRRRHGGNQSTVSLTYRRTALMFNALGQRVRRSFQPPR